MKHEMIKDKEGEGDLRPPKRLCNNKRLRKWGPFFNV